MNNREAAFRVREVLKEHHRWFAESLPLIASENVTSLLVREVCASDFSHRYAEGAPGRRFYQGCRYIDEVELLAIELAKRLFDAPYVNVQPTSGTVANLACFFALTRPGDTMMALQVPHGGHISHAELSAAGVRGLRVKSFPFDEHEMNIDVDRAAEKIRRVEPKLLLFGASIFLFPHPVRELSEVAREVGATVMYDAAHVLGLIAGGRFQQPLREGADVVSASRHKTFPGPQGGVILAREEYASRLNRAVFPGLVSNHHLHHLAGFAVALAEMLEFGSAYAEQVVRNARALAQALSEEGFRVLCEHKGFTESHQVLVDVAEQGGGTRVAEALERANIILNKNLLPWDDINRSADPSGIRIGTQEVTRLGMGSGEMQTIAELIARVVIKGESTEKVKKDVAELRREFNRVHYSFDDDVKDAYQYIEFF
ncbi:MAG: serine hydroxymethyltransferase [Euryarchaeota archaeon]|nr:serine hydroxymethyltransferase [Euryarchaeota archaeon]